MQNTRIYILDTAVSIVPKTWLKYPSINSYFQKYKRLPLINSSLHQSYLKSIPREFRKDRPDILHFALLTILGYSKMIPDLKIYFNLGDKLYEINAETRLPRDQVRFYGLIESIIQKKYKGNLITEVKFENQFIVNKKIVFTKRGKKINLANLRGRELIFGGFSTGKFKLDLGNDNDEISISEHSLDLWTAISMSLKSLIPN